MLQEIEKEEIEGMRFPSPFKFRGKVVGWFNEEAYLTKRTEEHIYKKFNSVGIDKSILDKLEEYGIKTIYLLLKTKEEERLYKDTLDNWRLYPDIKVSFDGSTQHHSFLQIEEKENRGIKKEMEVFSIEPLGKEEGNEMFELSCTILLSEKEFDRLKIRKKMGVILCE